MTQASTDKYANSTTRVLLLIILCLSIAVIMGGYYIFKVFNSSQEGQAASGAMIEKMIGLSTPIVGGNRLSTDFTDADGDLVADPPADAAKLIDPPTIVFTYIAQEEPEKSRDAWKPFTDYLSSVTGKPVEYKLISDSDEQLKAFRSGELHVCGFNSGNVPTAVDAAGFVPVCLVPNSQGNGTTQSAFIVPAGSGIAGLAEIRGSEVTYTYPTSNSGFKAPVLALLEKAQLRPGTDYNSRYSMGHEKSILGICKKEFEVAAVAKDMLERAENSGEVKRSAYRILYESESFPTASLGMAYNLKPELASKIRRAMMEFDWKGTLLEKELVSGAKTTFLPVNYKNDFSLLRKIDDVTGTRHEIK